MAHRKKYRAARRWICHRTRSSSCPMSMSCVRLRPPIEPRRHRRDALLRRFWLDHGSSLSGLPAIFSVLLDYDIAPVELNASIRHMAGAPEAIQDDITRPGGGRYNVPAHLDRLFTRMLALMQYLCKLITPPRGLILDPFGGSGTTGIAAIKEGFHYILIEQQEEYCEIARKRVAAVPARLDRWAEADA